MFRDPTSKERVIKPADIEERTELKTSLMPTALVATLTDPELRDLLAFLTNGAKGQSTTGVHPLNSR